MRTFLYAAALAALALPASAQQPAPPPAAPAAGLAFDQFAGRARERLMRLDADHDGRISKDEFAAGGGAIRRGTMQDAERPGGHDRSKMFARWDANQDGYLDTSEINAVLARRFARMDANHDRVLTGDERHAMQGAATPEQ
jgi:hypothetical protein